MRAVESSTQLTTWPMKLSIFTDEINPDPVRAVKLAADWGLTHVEVRSLPSGRFPNNPDAELAEFHALVQDAGLSISGVSPGFFKCPLSDPVVASVLEEQLPRACDWARRFGTDRISCFAFERGASSEIPVTIEQQLIKMADITASGGCCLVLENEPVCWGDTGLEAATR